MQAFNDKIVNFVYLWKNSNVKENLHLSQLLMRSGSEALEDFSQTNLSELYESR